MSFFSSISDFFARLRRKRELDERFRHLGSDHAAKPSNPLPLDPGNDPWRT